MSLNPSNLIASRTNPGRTMFPNLATREYSSVGATADTDKEYRERLKFVDESVRSELEQAGIEAVGPHDWLREKSEVPAGYIGELRFWGFKRAWYYWIAKGPGIPADMAEVLHKDFGTQCRVDGHCGCPSPREWFKGFAVGHYHVDTQEGLNALADLIRSIE